jgi:hypothetical protein
LEGTGDNQESFSIKYNASVTARLIFGEMIMLTIIPGPSPPLESFIQTPENGTSGTSSYVYARLKPASQFKACCRR